MNLHEHILPADMVEASRERKTVMDCYELIGAYVKEGNIKKAKDRAYDMPRSLHDLEVLTEKKAELDRRKHLLTGMHTVTHIELSRMMRNE